MCGTTNRTFTCSGSAVGAVASAELAAMTGAATADVFVSFAGFSLPHETARHASAEATKNAG